MMSRGEGEGPARAPLRPDLSPQATRPPSGAASLLEACRRPGEQPGPWLRRPTHRVDPRMRIDSCTRMGPRTSDLGRHDLRRRPLGPLCPSCQRRHRGSSCDGRFRLLWRCVHPHRDASFVEKRFVDARRRCLCTAASSTREATLHMRTLTPCIYITRICITHLCLTRICVPGTSYPFGPLSMQRPVV